jgi:hypothetical protein
VSARKPIELTNDPAALTVTLANTNDVTRRSRPVPRKTERDVPRHVRLTTEIGHSAE